jgi:opacity protein-like surface antigen
MKNLLAIILLSAFPAAVFAEGAYVAVDYGQAKAKDACSGLPSGYACSSSESAYSLGGGYKFTPALGIEANYGVLGTFKASGATGGTRFYSYVKPKTLQVAVTGTFPIASSLSFIGRVGVASTTIEEGTTSIGSSTFSSTSANATSTKLAYGIGVQYDIAKSVGMRVRYEDMGETGDASTGKTKISLLTAGLEFKF